MDSFSFLKNVLSSGSIGSVLLFTCFSIAPIKSTLAPRLTPRVTVRDLHVYDVIMMSLVDSLMEGRIIVQSSRSLCMVAKRNTTYTLDKEYYFAPTRLGWGGGVGKV